MTEILSSDYELPGQFYLGKRYSLGETNSNKDIYLYDSRDLLTHAVCIGMTGSGKTGLCINILEEAAMDQIPVIAIDPKGDLGNLLLSFPNLSPQEFEPWVQEEEAKRNDKSLNEFAVEQAEFWRSGLNKWGQDADRIKALKEKADFTLFTPGSTAGKSVSILSSFARPDQSILEDRELLGDKIVNVVTSLLSLIDIDADPLTSREHILVSKIIEHCWNNGSDVTLEDLVQKIQDPPVTKIGAFDLESFFPQKERFSLAMALNNLLASPGFESWLEGESLDIHNLLYTPSGKPRISIFSINHLSDSERMFFVSILLNQLLSWMRSQSGSSSLRALFYMDEIFGFFPPVANPPSKKPLLTLLKQARAFGLGIVLASQNPKDLDYKGLSNTGTWFIGRLQTERDKEVVLEGLKSSASNEAFENVNLDEVLSSLGTRKFLVNNVHEVGPQLIETRWAMSYLRGPFTRSEIKKLSSKIEKTVDSTKVHATVSPKPASTVVDNKQTEIQRPSLKPEIKEFFISAKDGTRYKPMLLVSGWVRFSRTRPPVDHGESYEYLIPFNDGPFPVLWDDHEKLDCDINELETVPRNSMEFSPLISPATEPKNYTKWNKEFINWVYKNKTIELFKSKTLKETSEPGETESQFRARLSLKAREKRDELLDKLRVKYGKKIKRLQSRIETAERALEREKRQAQDATVRSAFNIGASLLGAFTGRRKTISGNIRRASGAARSASYAANQQGDVAQAEAKLAGLEEEMTELENAFRVEMKEMEEKVLDLTSGELDMVTIRAKKSDIGVKLLALTWVPVP